MKYPRPTLTVPGDAQIAFAWYTREQWERLAHVAADRDQLDDTFQDWERNALDAVMGLESRGRSVRKIMVDVGALEVWCRERGLRLDGCARADYVAQVLKEEDRERPLSRW
jgi:hypothetical protein